MLSKLGCVLLEVNNHQTEIFINHITSDPKLESLVESFWDIGCCGTARKKDSKVIPKCDKRAADMLAKTQRKKIIDTLLASY